MSQLVRLNSVKDIIGRTGLSRSKLYEELESGRLKSVKVGRRRLITESQLIDYIDKLVAAGTACGDDVSTADHSCESLGAAIKDATTDTTGAVIPDSRDEPGPVGGARAIRLRPGTVMSR